MSHNCPWLIDDRAARDLLRITGRAPNDLSDALAELRQFARDIVLSDKEPKTLPSGVLQYRTGKPLRARLRVDATTHPPTLIEVLPDHEGRVAPYTKSHTRPGGLRRRGDR